MNIALIFAGGVGLRMNSKAVPKQFLKLHGKEIILYTLEHFEKHDDIDAIVIVCIKSWIKYLKEQIKKYRIRKVKWIVPGGETGQLSIYEGLKTLEKECPEDSIILIHDGVRPLINEKIITDNIFCVKEYGTAITVSPSVETVIIINDNGEIEQISDRSNCMMAKAPQSFYLKDILSAHKLAFKENRFDFIDSASIMNYYGFKLKTILGDYENIKITTPSDYYIFKALNEKNENSQILGM